MPQFMITYLGGDQQSSPELAKEHFQEYQKWLAALGDTAVSPANPIKNTNTVNPDRSIVDKSSTSMSGFTVIEVGSMAEALAAAKACPFLDIGGALEVSELIAMPSEE